MNAACAETRLLRQQPAGPLLFAVRVSKPSIGNLIGKTRQTP
jgi:hypothetical protein